MSGLWNKLSNPIITGPDVVSHIDCPSPQPEIIVGKAFFDSRKSQREPKEERKISQTISSLFLRSQHLSDDDTPPKHDENVLTVDAILNATKKKGV